MNPRNRFNPRLGIGPSPWGAPRAAGSPGLLARVLGVLVTIMILASALLFSVVLLVMLLFAGAVGLGWFWWQTRAVRRALRERDLGLFSQMPHGAFGNATVEPSRGTRRFAQRTDEVIDAQIMTEVEGRDRR